MRALLFSLLVLFTVSLMPDTLEGRAQGDDKPTVASVTGTVTEGRVAQPAAAVFLYDAKGNPVAKATTKADGTFAFNGLAPGGYVLAGEKPATGRAARAGVEVKAGATAAVALELLPK